MAASTELHPCQTCGACCAYFRVAFYWREAEEGSQHNVPRQLTTDLDSNQRCMQGTDHKHKPKCIALEGRIGQFANCKIYLNRPTPCRSFQASYEDGFQKIRCDEARAKHGLKPLTKKDWQRNDDLPTPT